MANKKVSGMTPNPHAVIGGNGAGYLTRTGQVPFVYSGVVGNYYADADLVQHMVPHAQVVVTGAAPVTVHPEKGPRIGITTGGTGGVENLRVAFWPYVIGDQVCDYGPNRFVEVYVKTLTNPADKVQVGNSGGSPFKVRIAGPPGGTVVIAQHAAPVLANLYDVAVLDWTYYGWTFDGTRSHFTGGGPYYTGPGVITSPGSITIKPAAGQQLILLNTPTADGGVSGNVWRDPGTGILHQRP